MGNASARASLMPCAQTLKFDRQLQVLVTTVQRLEITIVEFNDGQFRVLGDSLQAAVHTVQRVVGQGIPHDVRQPKPAYTSVRIDVLGLCLVFAAIRPRVRFRDKWRDGWQ